MSVKNSSIFNEVFGPVMIGPSSSHTAGPARISLSTRLMLPGPPSQAKVYFDRHGAYPPTYQGQGSDYGYIGGLMGFETGDPKLRQALKLARESGLDYEFIIGDLSNTWHPNCVRIETLVPAGTAGLEADYHLTVEGASTGGGTFLLTAYQGYQVAINGGGHEFLLITPEVEATAAKAAEIFNRQEIDHQIHISSKDGNDSLINIKSDQNPKGILESLAAAFPDSKLVYLRPVLPVVKRMASKEPFVNAGEALSHARANDIREAWALAVAYESSLSGKSDKEIIKLMGHLAAIMRQSAHQALEGGYSQRGFLPPQLSPMQKRLDSGLVEQFNLGVLNRAVMWACGILDYDLCQGLVVAAPTGGSSGVLPGAVISVGEEMGKSEDEINKALLVGGLIGVFIDHQATFAAEVAACQAEIGAASAMAAGAAVQLLGGTVDECFKAAALALQNLLGLICDPVAGIGNVPCVNRNATGVANALASANMVLAGFDPCIPLDEVICAMMDVGSKLPSCLRCTGDGGLCATPTALRMRGAVKL